MKKLLINVNVRCFIIVVCAAITNYYLENSGFNLLLLIPILLIFDSAYILIAQSCDSTKTDFSISRVYSVKSKPFLKRCCFWLCVWALIYGCYVYYVLQTYTFRNLIEVLIVEGIGIAGALYMNFVTIHVAKDDERTTLKTMDLDLILPWFNSKFVKLRKWLRDDS